MSEKSVVPVPTQEKPAYAQRVRLLFRKEGTAIYLSHLDLMRTMVRIFLRAGLNLRYGEGFNPRPYISLVRPLSLGYESREELCDIILTAPQDLAALPEKLNAVSPAGIVTYDVRTTFVPGSDIAWSVWTAEMDLAERGAALPEQLLALWRDPNLSVTKITKSGKPTSVLLAHQVRDICIEPQGDSALRVTFAARDEASGSLNPAFLFSAAEENIPDLRPEGIRYRREGYLNANGQPVR